MATYNNIQPWRDQFLFNGTQSGDLGTWGASSSLTAARSYHTAVVAKGFVFVFQGIDSSYAALNTILRAPIGNDGVVGTFVSFGTVPDTVTAPARYNAQAILLNNVVYIVGGRTSDGSVSSVIACPINSDGSLGTWFNATSLPGVIRNQTVCCDKNTIFSIGGYGTSTSAAVYHAPVDPETGEIGAWVTDSVSLPSARYAGAACIVGGSLYYIGGFNASSVQQASIYHATVDESGVLSSFSTYSEALPAGVAQHQLVVTGNTLYVIGGEQKTTVYKSTIGGDDLLGAFTACPSLPAVRFVSPAIITSSLLCLLGGFSASGFFATSISTPFAGGHNDYTGFDATEEVLPNSGPAVVDEAADDVSGVAATWNIGKLNIEELADDVTVLGYAEAIFADVAEYVDDVVASGYTPSIGVGAISEYVDETASVGGCSATGVAAVIEEVDLIALSSLSEAGASECIVAVAEPLDKVSSVGANTADRIVLTEAVDGTGAVAVTWNAGIITILEYRDEVTVYAASGETRGPLTVHEASDGAAVSAYTSNVGRVVTSCGVDGIAVATEEMAQAGSAIVAIVDPADLVSAQSTVGVGAAVRIEDPLDGASLHAALGMYGAAIVLDSLDSVSLRAASGMYGAIALDEPIDQIKLLSLAAAGDIPLFEFTRLVADMDGDLPAPSPATVLRFNRTVPALGTLVEITAAVEPFHFSR